MNDEFSKAIWDESRLNSHFQRRLRCLDYEAAAETNCVVGILIEGTKNKGSKAATGGSSKSTRRKKPSRTGAGENTDDQEVAAEDWTTPIDPAESVAETLEEIAQQLNEIAQDQLGKVELQKHVSTRLLTALNAVAQGVTNIQGRIAHE